MSNRDRNEYEQMEDLFKFILKGLDDSKIPEKVRKKVIEEIKKLKSFTLDARPARIAIVGRRGAGKSSLINAIFGELKAEIGDYKSQTGIGKWYPFNNELGEIEILDTRGLGESESPEEEVSAVNPVEEVKKSITNKCPDVILFLCKAKEVGARIDEDVHQLLALKQEIYSIHKYDVPIVGIVTQVDELAPVSDSVPPFSNPKKQANINATVDMLSDKLQEVVSKPVKVIPVCSYLEFEEDSIEFDRRWNINVLLDYLITELPREAQVILAKISKVKSVQKKLARSIGASVAGATGLIGAFPIPGPDLPVITGLQISMIGSIAMISGTKVNKNSIIEFLGAMGVNAGVGFALREVARQAVKILPGAGSVISGTLASAGTYALCEASIVYFIDKKSTEETKKTYKEKLDEKKKEMNEE